jgi:hypothetical protein
MDFIQNFIKDHINAEITNNINKNLITENMDFMSDDKMFDNNLDNLACSKMVKTMHKLFTLFDNIKYKSILIHKSYFDTHTYISNTSINIWIIITNYNFYNIIDCSSLEHGSIKFIYPYNMTYNREYMFARDDCINNNYNKFKNTINSINNDLVWHNKRVSNICYHNLYKLLANPSDEYSEESNNFKTIDELKTFITQNAIKITLPLAYIMYYSENVRNSINNIIICPTEESRLYFNDNKYTTDITNFFNKIDTYKLQEKSENIDMLNKIIADLKQKHDEYCIKSEEKMNELINKCNKETVKYDKLQEECDQYKEKNNVLEEKVNYTQNEMLLLIKENKNLKLRLELNTDLLSKMDMQQNINS